MRDYKALGWSYAEDVVSGKVPACKITIAACQRALDDLARQNTPEFPYVWSEAAASRVCAFVELCPHTKGELARTPIRLERWQVWSLSQALGWVHAGGKRDGKRRYRSIYLEVPRGNGKSALSSALALYFLAADGDKGATVVCAATETKQARLVFDESRAMVATTPLMSASRKQGKGLGLTANKDSISTEENGTFRPLSRNSKGSEGLIISAAILDELHLHPDNKQFSSIGLGAGKRPNSMIVCITTAGVDLTGICKQQHDYLRKILEPDPALRITDETYWGCVWSADDEDDWESEETWKKANPNYGISVEEGDFYKQYLQAKNIPAARKEFLTKKINRWVDAKGQFFDMEKWRDCQETLSLKDFEGESCFVGVDLSTASDLTAKVLLFPKDINGVRHWYCFPQFYLPEEALSGTNNQRYPEWIEKKYIKLVVGWAPDKEIEADLLRDAERFNIQKVCFDPWEARSLIARLQNDVECVTVQQTINNLSEPLKALDTMTREKTFHYDDPVLYWMASNTIVYTDGNGNIKPIKDKDLSRKNDGIMAIITALAEGLLFDEAEEFNFAFV